jgi:response regulator RpfG family c-di-GMP phosphodiesterase
MSNDGKRSERKAAPGATGAGSPSAPGAPAARAGVRPDIAERVLRHFRRNAQAMDSVEGIARFWVHEDRSVVERSLRDLHARGLLDKRTIAGTEFFSLPEHPREANAPGASPEAQSPVARSPGPASDVQPMATSRVPAGTAGRSLPVAEGCARVLVVDDDASVRTFIAAALTDAGHSVALAEDGQRAIEMVRGETFDLVLTDVKMPGMSGLQVLEEVKRLSPATEVIVVTAFASLDTAIKALRNGAYDLITKPLEDIETLYRVAQRALERRRLSSENRLLVQNLQARNVELKETVARLAAINEIGKATTGLLDLDELYGALVRLVAQHLKARRVSVLVSEPGSDVMTLVASIGIQDEEALTSRVKVGEGIAGRVAATQKPLLVEDIAKTPLRHISGGRKYSTASFMITPLMVSYPIRYQRRRVGVINVSDKHSGDPFTEEDLEFLSTLASQVAIAIENARLVREMEDGYFSVLISLIQASEDARPETRDHSMRVAELATSVARAMGLSEPRVDLLARAAALHEVGRLAARPAREPKAGGGGPDTTETWTSAAVMATEQILAPIISLRSVREIILRSADWFDSTATPFGSERSSLPIESRILAASEEFVRLTTGDGNAAGKQVSALDRMRRLAGRKHDPEVVAVLCRLVEEGAAR